MPLPGIGPFLHLNPRDAMTISISQQRTQRDSRNDRFFKGAVTVAGLFVLISLFAAAVMMFKGGFEAFQTFGLSFFTTPNWDVPQSQFGVLVPVFGTVYTSLIALLIAVPISFGIAIFLTELAPSWLRLPVSSAIELLAGIPSIIYGMWGLFILVPFLGEHVFPWLSENLGEKPLIGALFQGPPLGIGIGTAGLVLAIMIIPFIASVMREVFLTVPTQLKESAYALGSTTTEVVWNIVLPYTRSAVIGGIFLGLGRALGETMAVTFVIGNAYDLGLGLMNPGTSIASSIANEFGEAVDPLHKSTLLALGFVLFILTFIVLSIARLMLRSLNKRDGN